MTIQPLAFDIAHCSSWDDDYAPDELVNAHPVPQDMLSEQDFDVKVKGWQTPKCPTFPQDLIIHLACGPARITKIQVLSHHYKIATKIDVYIGLLKEPSDDMASVPTDDDDDDDDTLIEFTRLGYVCFDSNARAQYRARELKSIKINADGEYIRLVVRQCHQNRLNTYNQVGILALHVLGQPFSVGQNHGHHLPASLDGSSMLSCSTRRTSVSSTHSLGHGLTAAASGVVEMELQHWTSALLHAEELAVQDEAYGKAKVYKSISDKLSQFGKILVDLEQAKRHAVDTKDYDEAEKIKQDIGEIKLAAESILQKAHVRISDDGVVIDDGPEPDAAASAAAALDTDRMYEETIAKWTNFDASPMTPTASKPETPASMDLEEILMPPNVTSYEPIVLSASVSAKLEKKKKGDDHGVLPKVDEDAMDDEETGAMDEQDDEQDEQEAPPPMDPDLVPEPIMDEERNTYQDAIYAFGEYTVSLVLSVKVKCRENGLQIVQDKVERAYQQHKKPNAALFDATPPENDDLGVCFINATLMMLQEAIMDSRESIVLLTIQIWQQANDVYVDNKISPSKTWEWTRRAFNGLLKRTGDTNLAIRAHTVDMVLVLAHTHASPASASLLPLLVGKPERLIHPHKEGLARVQLVHRLVKELKKQPDGPVDPRAVVAFVKAYAAHNHDDVKKEAITVLATLATQIDQKTLNAYLDDDLHAQLQRHLGTANGKQHLVSDRDNAVAELRALSVKQVSKKSEFNTTQANSGANRRRIATDRKKPASTATPAATKRAGTTSTRATIATKAAPPQQQQPQQQETKEDKMCIFCDEYNESFNENTLITHYYKTCPALTTCSMCQTIVEVSTLQAHMLGDCEKKHLLKQCTRCKQATPVEQWLQHTLKNTCQAYTNNETRCPLCLVTISPPNDQGWRRHLLSGQGCPKNNRLPKDTSASSSSPAASTKPAANTSSTPKRPTAAGRASSKPSSLRKKN
ncbi:hypothetical protein BC940DRAFT_291149 [Gongronella butleri]|nr:hypothetical protein BC940DRAFT_291149 [Gongronella butleri]